MYYQDYKIAGSVELKSILEVLLSDNDEDKVQVTETTKENFIPTKNFHITVNKEDVLKTGTVNPADADKIAPIMQWTFNKGYVTKGTLAMFDILAHNNWKRPIYFASTVPSDQYNGLDSYLYNEGLALRLMPLTPDTAANRAELINAPVLYNNVMNKFKWGNIKDAKYLDPQSADDISIFSNVWNNTVTGMLKEGKVGEAKKAANKYLEVMPTKFYGMRSMMGTYFMAENFYTLGETAKANAIVTRCADYIQKELIYLADVSDSKNRLVGMQNVRLGMSFLNQMANTASQYKQMPLADKLNNQFRALETRFGPYLAQE
jgi:hypothetical protein